jgi:hypothetical protein
MMLDKLLHKIDWHMDRQRSPAVGMSTDYGVIDFLSLIFRAERFDFGSLTCEAVDNITDTYDEHYKAFRLPSLTDEELGFWFEGLLPLPSPICWYEFKVGDVISGILAKTDADGRISCQRVEYFEDGEYLIDGTWVTLLEDKKIRFCNEDGERLERLRSIGKDKAYDLFGSSALIIIYLTLMINSKSTEVHKHVPTKAQQSLRLQLRRKPLPEFTVVTIVPKRYFDEAGTYDELVKWKDGKVHSFKRMHWRRSHLRIIHKGLHNEKKIVIARMLVGRRELGEVKHDYVVRMNST